MEQLVVDNRKLSVKGIEGNSEYEKLVRELMLEVYTRDYTYSKAVHESRNNPKRYIDCGGISEFKYLLESTNLINEMKQQILSLGYKVPDVEDMILKEVKENLTIEYGKGVNVEAISYSGVTSIRMKEVKDIIIRQMALNYACIKVKSKKLNK